MYLLFGWNTNLSNINCMRRKDGIHKLLLQNIAFNIRHLSKIYICVVVNSEHWTQSTKFPFGCWMLTCLGIVLYFLVENMRSSIDNFHKKGDEFELNWRSELSGGSLQYYYSISVGILSHSFYFQIMEAALFFAWCLCYKFIQSQATFW